MAAIPGSNATGAAPLAFDARSLEALRGKAAADPKAAVRESARQFEALFMGELMKSLRATVRQGSEENGGNSGLGVEMLDSQLATQLAGRPGGLTDAIARQLERQAGQMGLTPGPIPSTATANPVPAPLQAQPRVEQIPQKGPAGFVQQHGDAARAAEAATGIPAQFMISQAALETGWGRKEIRHADGQPAHNLFGIKAGANWKGPVAEVTTTEYIDGRPQKVVARFRAYASYAESFADYARLMKDNPRYQGVIAAGGSASGFAHGLQKAGYATDPAYASKLTAVINTTLRLQRSLA